MASDQRRAADRGGAGIGRIRLVIEWDGLVQRFGRPVPDTAALIARIGALRHQLDDAHPSLDLVVARFGDTDADALAAEAGALGLDALFDAAGARLAAFADAAGLGPPDAGIGVILFAGRPDTAARTLAARIPAYLVSDRPPADHRQLAIAEAPRVVAETLRLAVPRPMAPAQRTGALIAVPARDAAEARARGRAALEDDIAADWMTLGDVQILWCPDPVLAARVAAMPGARRLADAVRLDQLALALPGDGNVVGTPVIETEGYRFGALTGPGILPWRNTRRARFAVDLDEPTPPPARTPLPHAAGVTAGDAGLVLSPYLDDRSEDVLAIVFDDEDGRPLAAALQARIGGAAALIGAARADLETMIDTNLWNAERNCLRGAVQIAPPSRQTVSAEDAKCRTSASSPAYPIVALLGGKSLDLMVADAARWLGGRPSDRARPK